MHACHALSALSSQCQKQNSEIQAHTTLPPPVMPCDLNQGAEGQHAQVEPGAARMTSTAPVMPYLVEAPCAWKELAIILVEADRHHPVGRQESLLHTIAVVDVNVHIQHPAGSRSR